MAKNQNDETIVNVEEVYTKTEQFVDKNRKVLFGVLGGVAALFAGYFAYTYLVKQPKELEAANALWKAEQWMEIDSVEWALNGNGDYSGFEGVATEYSGTMAGKQAHYFAGIIYRDRGEFETAITHFKEADFGDQTISVLATGAVGDCYIELANIEEGAKWLEKAAKSADKSTSKNFLAPLFALKASKAYLELGNDDKARSLLQNIVDGYDKKSQEYSEAEKLLAMLKAKG